VAGGDVCDSERPLSVGGTGSVDRERFAGFDYVALGHLHRCQTIGGTLHYPGSLLKYSFAEAAHHKSVTLVELDAAGGARIEPIRLTPRRDLRILEGRLADLLVRPAPGASLDDYLLVRLTDKEALLDPIGKLRTVYPNVLHLERPGLLEGGTLGTAGRDHLRHTAEELFASFFEQVTDDPLGDPERAVLAEVIEDLRRGEREASA
jgi:exonuclease SbcD